MQTDAAASVRVLIVSDNHMIRAGVRMILETQATSYAIGEATTAQAAVDAATQAQADILLVDLDLSGVDIVDLIQRLKNSAPNPLILVLSNLGDDDVVRKALRSGAAGVVLKVQPPAVLNAAIESLCGISPKRSELPPARPTPIVFNGFSGEQGKRQDVSRISSLTRREREIIRLIGKGLKNKDIAGQLGISEITVRHHLSNIFSKLEVLDRQKLLIFAHRNRLVEMV
jgi:DNA-binding NarL/FixJ family response regulator